MKNLKLLFAVALIVSGAPALALDSPHDGTASSSVTECQSCHRLHGGGGTLTKYSSNNDACLTCHDSIVPAPNSNHIFSPAWSSAGREATPGVEGDQHRWSGSPTARSARVPLNPDMAKYLPTGATLQCAVCHDAHGKKDAVTGVPIQDTLAPSSVHSSYKLDVAMPPNSGGAGRLKLVSLTGYGFQALTASYAVRVRSAGYLEISHDYKSAAVPTWVGNIPFTVGDTPAQDVGLDDPAVIVRITVAPAVGEVWEFYVSYPFLRASNVADAMCTDCHADRVMDHACVEGTGAGCAPGTKVYSHPVNQALNANAKGYDRGAPLDADGGVADTNASNDLKLDGSVVRCTTCHAPHNADSNSLSVDVR